MPEGHDRTEQQQQCPLDPLRHGHCQIGNAGKGADGQDVSGR